MKRIALTVIISALLAGCASSSTAGSKHYSVVPKTQVTVKEKRQKQHTTYSVRPEEQYVSGSGSR